MVKPESNNGRPRVLVVAEAANPEWASVPLVGWCHARALSHVCNSHLVTQIRNRDAIARAGLEESRDFTAIDSERVAAPLYQLGNAIRGRGKAWTLMTAIQSFSYRYFEACVWSQFRKQLLEGAFDIVHRVTPVSPTVPSPLAKQCHRAGVPFVWGPINGGVEWPKQYQRERHREQEWLSYLRGVYRWLPGYRSTRENAASILVGSRATLRQIDEMYRGKCVYIPENGVDVSWVAEAKSRFPRYPLRIVFVGRLVPYKGADILIEAAAPLLRRGMAALDIIGDGPLMPELESLLDRKQVRAAVRLHGWLDHSAVRAWLEGSDILGFPSIREFGGGVVLEAMAAGAVPMIVDYAGPGELVTETTGYKVPLGDRESIVAGFNAALSRIIENPADLVSMRLAAQKRVGDLFTWEAKARQVLEVYRWILGARPDRPMFEFS